MRKSVAAVIAASTALVGCGDHGGGGTVARNYQVGNFQQIEVAGPYDVDVRTGSRATVSASGPEKLLGSTVVAVQGDKLVIHPENSHGLHFGWGIHGNARFTITVPQLTGASKTIATRATESAFFWSRARRNMSTGSSAPARPRNFFPSTRRRSI